MPTCQWHICQEACTHMQWMHTPACARYWWHIKVETKYVTFFSGHDHACRDVPRRPNGTKQAHLKSTLLVPLQPHDWSQQGPYQEGSWSSQGRGDLLLLEGTFVSCKCFFADCPQQISARRRWHQSGPYCQTWRVHFPVFWIWSSWRIPGQDDDWRENGWRLFRKKRVSLFPKKPASYFVIAKQFNNFFIYHIFKLRQNKRQIDGRVPP